MVRNLRGNFWRRRLRAAALPALLLASLIGTAELAVLICHPLLVVCRECGCSKNYRAILPKQFRELRSWLPGQTHDWVHFDNENNASAYAEFVEIKIASNKTAHELSLATDHLCETFERFDKLAMAVTE